MSPDGHPDLSPLAVLVGEWATRSTHPELPPSTVVEERATFAWLEGERFLVHRSSADHPAFPTAIAVIGARGEDDDALAMHYFDSRGVQRLYDLELRDGVWTMARDAPGFSQRFTGTIAADGATIDGLWTLSRDGTRWDDDLAIVYGRSR